MPKAVLEFNLPEEADDFKLASSAGNMNSALFQVDQKIFRRRLKYESDNYTESELELLETLRREFFEVLAENDVELV